MSMISSLIDELSKSADECSSINMFEMERICREAADTIWQLRDDLQQANAETAKLRELVRDMWRGAMWRMDHAERFSFAGDFVDKMRELGIEVNR